MSTLDERYMDFVASLVLTLQQKYCSKLANSLIDVYVVYRS